MNIEEALKLIDEQKITHVKVLDFNKRIVMRFDETAPSQIIEKVKTYQASLMSHGKVEFVCATDQVHKANWKDALHWQVVFNGSINPNNQMHGGHLPGFISASEAMLQAQIAEMKMEMKFKKQMEEFEKKFSGNTSKGGFDDLIKFLPLAGLVLKLSPEQLQTIGAFSNVSAMIRGEANNQHQQSINGLNGAKIELSAEEEKLSDDIDDEINKLSEKVPLSDIHKFIATLNEKPEFLKTLMALAENHK